MGFTYTQMEDVTVTAVRTVPYNAVQVGIQNKPAKSTHNALLGQFRKNNVADPKRKLAEFRVSDDAILVPGGCCTQKMEKPGLTADVDPLPR
jgi:large subunit ribosomal protein L3